MNAISRRGLILSAAAFIGGLPSPSRPQALGEVPGWAPWQEIPSITVISAEGDYRLPFVSQAVDFWNAEFSRLGSPFRLGAVVDVVGDIPAAEIHSVKAAPFAPPDSVRRAEGDVIVALSEDANFASFTIGWRERRKALIAIRRFSSTPSFPLKMPDTSRNDIVHEFGHAVGLGHNSDSATLMCGGAWCRFTAPREDYFPLTKAEERKLLELYPPSWKSRPKTWKADPHSGRTSG
jgi:hypothetical protein